MNLSLRIPRSILVLTAVIVASLSGFGVANAVGARADTPTPRPTDPARAATVGGQTETYTGVKPCRVLDTRATTPLGASTRSFQVTGNLTGQGGLANCGIPAYATSIAINLTGISTGSTGFIRGWAFNGAAPTATLLNFAPEINASNQVNIPLCRGAGCTSAFNLRAFSSSVDVVGDAVGYYSAPIHGSVAADGTLQPGSSGITYASSTGTGSYDVGVDRDVTDCAVMTSNRGFDQDTAPSSTVFGGLNVFLTLRDSANALKSSPFYISIIC